MRKFYMFRIQKRYQGTNGNDLKSLYIILENLYYLNTNKLNFGISIYDQLCKRFEKGKLLKYFKGKIPTYYIIKNRIIIREREKALLAINESCLVLYTNASISKVFKYLNLFDSNIFVCDFGNNDFFWLRNINEQVKI